MEYNTTMTTQEKLKIITDNIRQKLPRLMELEEGCLVEGKFNHSKNLELWKVLGKETDGLNEIYPIICKTKDTISGVFKSNNRFILSHIFPEINTEFKIIGKEPMLNDVLEWTGITKKYLTSSLVLAIGFYGSICNIDFNSKHLDIYCL
ncbi:hypothetical protein PG299_10100 [Riemerella anatipestifer]|nr:hypothetical protein [Riemerella anatipestifer]